MIQIIWAWNDCGWSFRPNFVNLIIPENRFSKRKNQSKCNWIQKWQSNEGKRWRMKRERGTIRWSDWSGMITRSYWNCSNFCSFLLRARARRLFHLFRSFTYLFEWIMVNCCGIHVLRKSITIHSMILRNEKKKKQF